MPVLKFDDVAPEIVRPGLERKIVRTGNLMTAFILDYPVFPLSIYS